MNIIYITNHLNIGGITSYVLTLARGMKKRGHQVYLASSSGQLLPRFLKAGINYIPIPIKTKQEISPGVFISMFKLSGAVKKYQIDIVHANSRTTQVLGCLLNRFLHIPYVSTCHGFFKTRFFRKMFPCWGEKTIAISGSVKEHLMRDFGLREEAIRVVHNGIDVEKFKRQAISDVRQAKIRWGLRDGPVVGIIARLSEEKGHLYLIEAMREVFIQIPQAQLLIVGEGRRKQELLNLTRELGLEKNIKFVSAVTDTREVLVLMDLFVLPSSKEGLGLALMEAMATGLAVIGSDVGGIRSLIQDGKNGLLVKSADTQELAAAILALLRDAQKRESLGKAAQDFIRQNFSQEKMVQETERVYLECLSAKY